MDEDGSISYMVLLGHNMPHIMEKIFLHLNRQSIKNSQQVCQGWKEVLSSDYFKTRWDSLHPFCHLSFIPEGCSFIMRGKTCAHHKELEQEHGNLYCQHYKRIGEI